MSKNGLKKLNMKKNIMGYEKISYGKTREIKNVTILQTAYCRKNTRKVASPRAKSSFQQTIELIDQFRYYYDFISVGYSVYIVRWKRFLGTIGSYSTSGAFLTSFGTYQDTIIAKQNISCTFYKIPEPHQHSCLLNTYIQAH